jgi:phage terminase small subunit
MTKRPSDKPRPKAKRATRPKAAPAGRMKTAEGILVEKVTDRDLKLTPKQETFCQAYVETGIGAEAFRRAYDTSNWTDKSIHEKASQMLSTVKIRSRVDQLKAAHRRRHDYTVDDLVEELEEARKLAQENGNAAPMVQATMGKGKLLGLIIDKAEHTGKDGSPLLQEADSRDIARAVLDVLREARLADEALDATTIETEHHQSGHAIAPDDEAAAAVIVPPAVADLAPRKRTYNPLTKRLE